MVSKHQCSAASRCEACLERITPASQREPGWNAGKASQDMWMRMPTEAGVLGDGMADHTFSLAELMHPTDQVKGAP